MEILYRKIKTVYTNPKSILIKFMNADYTHQQIINDIEDYNIKNVVKKFLQLVPNSTK